MRTLVSLAIVALVLWRVRTMPNGARMVWETNELRYVGMLTRNDLKKLQLKHRPDCECQGTWCPGSSASR